MMPSNEDNWFHLGQEEMALEVQEQQSQEGRILACAHRLSASADWKTISDILQKHRVMKEHEMNNTLSGTSPNNDVQLARYYRGYADGILFCLNLPEKIKQSEIKEAEKVVK